MRKLIKRIAVCVSAFALVAAGIVAGKADAVKAAEIDTTAHVIVKGKPEGTDKIGFNIWNKESAWVDTKDYVNLQEATKALSAWGWTGETWVGNVNMTQDANGMYTCTIKFNKEKFNAKDCGVQVFIYGAENAAVAGNYTSALHELLADENVKDIYIIADYTKANGADGGVLTIQKDNPLADNSGDKDDNASAGKDDNASTGKDDNASAGKNDNASAGKDNNTSAGKDNNTQPKKDVTTGDATSIVMFIAVAAVAAATVVITRKKSVEE